jgi:osmotically inducible lipoprotein OsmB
MNTRKMGVVMLLMMFVIIGAALSGYSGNPSKQDVGAASGAVIGGVVDSTLNDGSAVGIAAGAANRIERQLDHK